MSCVSAPHTRKKCTLGLPCRPCLSSRAPCNGSIDDRHEAGQQGQRPASSPGAHANYRWWRSWQPQGQCAARPCAEPSALPPTAACCPVASRAPHRTRSPPGPPAGSTEGRGSHPTLQYASGGAKGRVVVVRRSAPERSGRGIARHKDSRGARGLPQRPEEQKAESPEVQIKLVRGLSRPPDSRDLPATPCPSQALYRGPQRPICRPLCPPISLLCPVRQVSAAKVVQ